MNGSAPESEREAKAPEAVADAQQLPSGFRYAGVACGIKPSGKPDVSLIVTDQPVTAAAVTTQNQIVAAPVVICRSRTPSSRVRAVVTNSGNANACTGDEGMRNAKAMTRLTASMVGCDPQEVLVMSTGVIGQQLPMDRVEKGISAANAALAADPESFEAAADAIRTTDKDRKLAFRSVRCEEGTYRIAAMAKGAGMIAPDMATMLAVVVTDAPLTPADAQRLLTESANVSFNRVSVDGHTSTNDTLLLLANSQQQALRGESLRRFSEALTDLSVELAKRLVADGEGAKHWFELNVRGAADAAAANVIAATVAASPLVKTAITGADPNWGRIVSAVGYADAVVEPEEVTLQICGVTIYERGRPIDFEHDKLRTLMQTRREVKLELVVGTGTGQATRWASDLTTEYVLFNSEYTT